MGVRIENPLSRLNQEWTPGDQTIVSRFNDILKTRIEAGFHEELGISRQQYWDTFQDALTQAQRTSMPGVPVFVEPRIPLNRQATLLGVEISPSVWQLPTTKRSEPYAAWLRTVHNPGIEDIEVFLAQDFSNPRAVDIDPDGGEQSYTSLANPFEALSADIVDLLEHRIVYLAGTPGIFRQRFLALDSFLGNARLTAPDRHRAEYFSEALVSTKK